MAKDARTQAIADRNDLYTGVIIAALVIGWLVFDATRSLRRLFSTPGAVTVTAPIPEQAVAASFGGAAVGSGAVATTDAATLVVPGVNIVSVSALALAIVLPALLFIAAAVLSVLVCLRLLRGVVFDPVNTALTFWISAGILAAGLCGPAFRNLGLNGVFAALEMDSNDQAWRLLSGAAPSFVAAIAVGVLVIVFRRGAALQKDAEGLV